MLQAVFRPLGDDVNARHTEVQPGDERSHFDSVAEEIAFVRAIVVHERGLGVVRVPRLRFLAIDLHCLIAIGAALEQLVRILERVRAGREDEHVVPRPLLGLQIVDHLDRARTRCLPVWQELVLVRIGLKPEDRIKTLIAEHDPANAVEPAAVIAGPEVTDLEQGVRVECRLLLNLQHTRKMRLAELAKTQVHVPGDCVPPGFALFIADTVGIEWLRPLVPLDCLRFVLGEIFISVKVYIQAHGLTPLSTFTFHDQQQFEREASGPRDG